MARIVHWLRAEPTRIILVVLYLSFVAGWSSIVLWRFYSFNSYIFDLGVAMERGWLIYHTAWTLPQFLNVFFTSGILFVVFPITIPQSYPVLLIFQVAEVGAAAFPLFGIARHFRLSPVVSLMIAGSFLAFFPLNGALWFDMHYQTLFMVLFLTGYYYHLKGNLIVAGILIALSGTVRFPYAAFPLLFGAWTITTQLAPRLFGSKERSRNNLAFGTAVAAVSVFFLVGGFLYASGNALPHGANPAAGTSLPFGGDLALKLTTVLLILGPVLLIPFCSPKWILFLLPYGFLVFVSGLHSYFVPNIYAGAYASGIAPFVFLGFIEGLPRALRFINRRASLDRHRKTPRWRRPVDSFEVVAVSTTVIVVAALFLTPYGPFNQFTSQAYRYDLYSAPGPNFTLFHEVESVIGFIPASSPYIIAQEGLPELYPRPIAQATYPVINPVLDTFPLPITEQEIVNNTIPIDVYGTIRWTHADYAVGDPYLWTFSVGSPTIATWMQLMYDSGHFGIVAEESDITLLARDYTGPVKAFVPWSDVLSATNASPTTGGSALSIGTAASSFVWQSQSDVFVPGSYRVSAKVWLDSASCAGTLNLSLHNGTVGRIIGNTTVSTCGLVPHQWNWVSFPVTVSGMWVSLYVEASFSSVVGGQMPKAVLTQTGPPENAAVI